MAHVGDVDPDAVTTSGEANRLDGVIVILRVGGIESEDEPAAEVLATGQVVGTHRSRRGRRLAERVLGKLVPDPVPGEDRLQLGRRVGGGAEDGFHLAEGGTVR